MTEAGGRGDAAQAPRAAGPSEEEWIAACRRAVEVQKQVFAEHQGIEARTQYEGVGEGGDRTLVIDRLCEDADLRRARARSTTPGTSSRPSRRSGGSVTFGGGESPLRVVIDPIDGSLNARRTIPLHSVSIAVADGDSMADVTFGYVYEFGAREEFIATPRGGAARRPADSSAPGRRAGGGRPRGDQAGARPQGS